MRTNLLRMLPRLSGHVRLQALGAGLLALAVAGVVLGDPVTHDQGRLVAAPTPARHSLQRVTSDAAFAAGTLQGARVSGGSVSIATPAGTTTYAGKRWSYARWTGPWVTTPRSFSQLVPTWDALTPAGTFVQVQVRARSTVGTVSGWKTMASWATRDAGFRRASAGTQRDAVAGVSTDTLTAGSGVSLAGYQLRTVLLRAPGSTASPTLRSVQAVATLPASGTQTTSRPLLPATTLAVPRYSQMTHRGQYPQWGGGGQAWCSPTSLSMILGYYRTLPAASSYAWVSKNYADPWVDHVARVVYDYGYQGAGNWAFNTAYAATLTGDAFVTRLGNLREAERFIAAGIPLAASITFSRGQLDGAPIGATAGHLVVISGFTSTGDVVVNDPAAPSNASVRRVYDRGQFERAWQTRSQGTVYVVHDAAHPLPVRGVNRNW